MRTWTTKSGYRITRILSGRSNVFLLANGKTNFLIDTSVGRLWNKLQKRLKKAGVSRIEYLILTHAHFDHAANANKIKAKYSASVPHFPFWKHDIAYIITNENQQNKDLDC